MTWFIMECVVVCAVMWGFMATHSLAAAIVMSAPVLAAIVWLRSIQVEDNVLWLVAGVPLLAAILGLMLGQYVRHRAWAQEMPPVPPPVPESWTRGHVLLPAGDLERSAQIHGGRSMTLVTSTSGRGGAGLHRRPWPEAALA